MQDMPEEIGFTYLDEINNFRSLGARMPTDEECERLGITPDIPVFVVHFTGGPEHVQPANRTEFALLANPVPDADGIREAAVSILNRIVERAGVNLGDLDDLRMALSKHDPRKVAVIDKRLQELEEDDYEAAELLERARADAARSPSGVVTETGPLG